MSTPRDQILTIFHGALAAVHGTTCVERFLALRRLEGNVQAVAVGKAADAMLLGARSVLGEQLRTALLITKRGYAISTVKDVPGITVIEAGHPVPDEASLQAGQAMLNFISATPEDTQLLFLISGGASEGSRSRQRPS